MLRVPTPEADKTLQGRLLPGHGVLATSKRSGVIGRALRWVDAPKEHRRHIPIDADSRGDHLAAGAMTTRATTSTNPATHPLTLSA